MPGGRLSSADLRHDDPGRAGGPCPPYADARVATEVLITCLRVILGGCGPGKILLTAAANSHLTRICGREDATCGESGAGMSPSAIDLPESVGMLLKHYLIVLVLASTMWLPATATIVVATVIKCSSRAAAATCTGSGIPLCCTAVGWTAYANELDARSVAYLRGSPQASDIPYVQWPGVRSDCRRGRVLSGQPQNRPAYVRAKLPLAKRRLRGAGRRLAEVLNTALALRSAI